MNEFVNIINAHWSEIINSVRDEILLSDVSYKTWFLPLKVYDIVNDTIIITTPSDYVDFNFHYVKLKYGRLLKVAISEILNVEYEIDFRPLNELESNHSSISSTITQDSKSYISDLNPMYTFDNFIESPSSNLAYSAALSVAESPGEYYNPLFIWGGVGLGKTHLMQSIAHMTMKHFPNKKVLYVKSESFTNELVQAIRFGKASPEELRKKYRNLDVLLIDDIQFIIGKESTQEEFFHTFNALYEAKKQIVISSDKPPKDFTTLEDRLLSRFECGLLVDIQPPTYEIRMAILKKKMEAEGFDFKEEILDYIASNITSNVRELEGSLNKIKAISRLQRLQKNEITLDVAKDALKSFISPNDKKKVDLNYIAEKTAEHFGITMNEMYSNNRSRNIAYPRQIVMYLCRKLTSLSLTEIGEKLGKRDHTTILHGVQKIEDDIIKDPAAANTIDILIKKINPQ